MTTVTGILRDAQQNAIPNAGVTVRYTRALVGFNGGAVAQNDRLFTTDGSGLLTMTDLIPGHYDVFVSMPVNANTTQTAIKLGTGTVPTGEATLSWEAFLQEPIGQVDSTVLQQAIDAKDDAEAAAATAVAAAAGVEFPVSYAPQTLDAGQKAQARENIGTRFRDAPHLFEFIPSAQHAAILNGTSSYDATGDINTALLAAAGSTLLFPRGVIMARGVLKVWPGTIVQGAGKHDSWDQIGETGTCIDVIDSADPWLGAGRWTDIDGNDPTDFKPSFVAMGNEVQFRDISVRSPYSENRGDAGFFFPAVKQCSVTNIATLGPWQSGLYLDATWGNNNQTLKDVQPDVVPSQGMNEFSAFHVNLQGVRPLNIQGTTRDLTQEPNPGTWAQGGTSDIVFVGGQMRPRGITAQEVWDDGRAISIDAAINNGAQAGQGIRFFGVAPRGRAANHTVFLDRCNRVEFVACYGEGIGSPQRPGFFGKVETSTRTGTVVFIGGAFGGCEVWRNGSVISGGSAGWDNIDVWGPVLTNVFVVNHQGKMSLNGGVYARKSADTAAIFNRTGNSGIIAKFQRASEDALALSATVAQAQINALSERALVLRTADTNRIILESNGNIVLPGLPTSAAGLPPNTIWNDGGTLKVT